MSESHKKTAMSYLFILFGTGLMAFAIQCIYDPIGLVTGGFTGIAIVIKTLTVNIWEGGIPLWLTNIVLNIPVFIFSYILLGRKFVGRTLFGTLVLSMWLYIIPTVDIAGGDYVLAAIFGGLFSGVGMGFVLKGNATTGGTDMVAALIQYKVRHHSVAEIMQFVDGAVVLMGMFVFGIRPALYAIAAVYIVTKVSDAILEGFNYSKAAYIITERYEEIARILMEELDRGVTGLHAKGMYTGDDKCVLYCVVSRKQIVTLKDIVVKVDPDAFVIVSDVREVLGEGFQEYKDIQS